MRSRNQKEFGAFTAPFNKERCAPPTQGDRCGPMIRHGFPSSAKRVSRDSSLRHPCLCGAFSLNLRVAHDGQNVQRGLLPRPGFSSTEQAAEKNPYAELVLSNEAEGSGLQSPRPGSS